ncbi:MAG: alpha/beta fold hydrolase [Proteobacteria bacterium]|nr:alpha/beta fold hydrolase [Pseudomonadota bacterium]
MTQVGGRAVEIALQGRGSPSVVFESGLGDDLSPWMEVASSTARRATSLAYSRAGYGRSATSWSPRRDPRTVAAELDELLQTLGVPAPYVLVGHSLGGLYVQAYAAAYPQKVAGLVLVDPTHPDQVARVRGGAPGDARFVGIASHLFSGPMRAEFQAHGDATAFPEPVYAGPVIVMAAERKQMLASDAFHKLRGTLLREIAAHYPQGELRSVDAGHYIQREKPAAVVDAIEAIVDRLGAPRAAAMH